MLVSKASPMLDGPDRFEAQLLREPGLLQRVREHLVLALRSEGHRREKLRSRHVRMSTGSVNYQPLARIETIKLLLHLIPYRGRSRTLDFQPNKEIIIPCDQELKLMRREYRAAEACER